MGLIFFHSVTFSSRILTVERVLGTLELAYMSPSNKFGLLIGNSIVGIFKNAWISIILFFIIINLTSFNYKIDFIDILIMIPLFIIPSICWGVFINSIMMFSRHLSMILTIFLTPLGLVSGTKIPINILPIVLKIISIIIPLTWSLIIVRGIIFQNSSFKLLIIYFLILILLCITLIILAKKISEKGENYLKKTGSFTFF